VGVVSREVIEEGDYVLIYVDPRRRRVVKVSRGARFESDKGALNLENLIGLPYGSRVRLSTGAEAYALKPTHTDLTQLFERVTQVIYPKDIGLMIVLSGVGPGSRVLEIGVGTGYLTSFLANLVRPDGLIVGYEIRPDYAEKAIKNLRKLGLDKYVVIKIGDAREGLEKLDRKFDIVFIDIPDPWNVYPKLNDVVVPSAPVISFLPTVNQVLKVLEYLSGCSCATDVRVYETLLREYEVKREALRPRTLSIVHTGYILFFRFITPKPQTEGNVG
jgi:tRNA (adenine57-N1/adenine58-N1)-methyltransferase